MKEKCTFKEGRELPSCLTVWLILSLLNRQIIIQLPGGSFYSANLFQRRM